MQQHGLSFKDVENFHRITCPESIFRTPVKCCHMQPELTAFYVAFEDHLYDGKDLFRNHCLGNVFYTFRDNLHAFLQILFSDCQGSQALDDLVL